MKTTFRISMYLILILAVLLSGCKPSVPPTATAKPAEPTAKPAEPTSTTPPEPVTITVWMINKGGSDWIKDTAVPAFEAKNPGIKVDVVFFPEEEFKLKVETAVAANQAPDVGMLILFNVPKIAPTGGLLELTQFMDNDGLKTTDFCPSIHSRFNYLGDKLYALPQDTNAWGMMYNVDLFKAAGAKLLTPDDYITYDDWLDIARKTTTKSDDLNKYIWGSALFYPRWNSMNNYMSKPFVLGDDGKTAIGNADSPDYIHLYEVMYKAYQEGLMPEAFSTVASSNQMTDLFNAGRIAMIYATLANAEAAKAKGINVALTGQPVVTKGWKGNVGSWEDSWSIFKSSQHPQEAWKFIKYMTENGALISAQASGGFANAAIPCLLSSQQAFLEASGNDPFIQQSFTLLSHVQAPPWTVDVWTSTTPFDEAWRRITVDNVDVATAVHDAANEAQKVTDGLWEEWNKISNP